MSKRKDPPTSSSSQAQKKKKTSEPTTDTSSEEKFLKIPMNDHYADLLDAINTEFKAEDKLISDEFKGKFNPIIGQFLQTPNSFEEGSVMVKLGMTEFTRVKFSIEGPFTNDMSMYAFGYDDSLRKNGDRCGITSMSKVTDKKLSNCFTQLAKTVKGSKRKGLFRIVLAVCKTNSVIELYISDTSYSVDPNKAKSKVTNVFVEESSNDNNNTEPQEPKATPSSVCTVSTVRNETPNVYDHSISNTSENPFILPVVGDLNEMEELQRANRELAERCKELERELEKERQNREFITTECQNLYQYVLSLTSPPPKSNDTCDEFLHEDEIIPKSQVTNELCTDSLLSTNGNVNASGNDYYQPMATNIEKQKHITDDRDIPFDDLSFLRKNN